MLQVKGSYRGHMQDGDHTDEHYITLPQYSSTAHLLLWWVAGRHCTGVLYWSTVEHWLFAEQLTRPFEVLVGKYFFLLFLDNPCKTRLNLQNLEANLQILLILFYLADLICRNRDKPSLSMTYKKQVCQLQTDFLSLPCLFLAFNSILLDLVLNNVQPKDKYFVLD